ncbi:MAG: 23S rRNA (guanine2445-N2)-methyltransferase / 23S rRNA (guanine2069-N7)-methyltransferase [Halieaceae bacterium]
MEADEPRRWVATCPRAIPPLLAAELRDLGASDLLEHPASVAFTGTRAVMYRACLWSRLANGVLLPLGEGPASSADVLYEYLLTLPWSTCFAAGCSIAVAFHGSSDEIRNTRFGAQRCKDAIVDSFRAAGLTPPPVRPDKPDILVVARLHRNRVEIALDMVGESLHRRGYRRGSGEAPIKENLAAALLLRAGWPALAARGGALLDPMCGAGTLLLEGALMAADKAPALGREHFSFMAWQGHSDEQWGAVHLEAQGRAERGLAGDMPEIRGYDGDPRVIRRAEENIAAAGMERFVRVGVKALHEVRKPTHRPLPEGLLITNPPYGERMGSKDSLPALFRRLGELLHDQFGDWQAAIVSGDRDLGYALGLRSHRQYSFYNGRIPITLLLLDMRGNRLTDGAGATLPVASAPSAAAPAQESAPAEAPAQVSAPTEEQLDPGAQMFANRLRKNQRQLKKWLKRRGQECYRLYDADMPEYAVAVDRYGDWLHVAEYRAPAQVDAQAAAARLASVRAALPLATGIDAQRIVFKTRERQRGSAQYQSQAQERRELSVGEGAARLLVNLHDYLDTGLFLDLRPLRLRIGEQAKGKRFLNLYCYSGSATIHAALGGAQETVSVDLSNTYLSWLRRNLAHNGLPETRNHSVRADVLNWLEEGSTQFDLILLDPPSFSNSKRMSDSFDVQRDHVQLLERSMARLAPGGTLYFANNRRKFRLDARVAERYHCEDITEATLDPDFPRRPAPHQCWQLSHC